MQLDLPIYSSESSPRVRYLSKKNSSPFYNSINGHMIDIGNTRSFRCDQTKEILFNNIYKTSETIDAVETHMMAQLPQCSPDLFLRPPPRIA